MEPTRTSESATSAAPRPAPRPSRANTPPHVVIEPRKVNIDFESGSERYWYRGSPGLTFFIDSLSTLFPEGEKFFIESVRNFADRIDDPELEKQARAFYAQEGQHTREHRDYNARVAARGFDVPKIERETKFFLDLARRFLSKKDQLAITCALEHFTAIMAHQLLADPSYTEGTPEAYAQLWRWHAAEETEHKSVAYDVYQAVGGGYFRRTFTMLTVTAGFMFAVARIWLHMMVRDRKLLDLKSWGALIKWGLINPGFARKSARLWLDYFKPGFHPWDHDNSEYIARWKAEWAPPYEALA